MLKTIVLCSVAAALAISIAACGKSVESVDAKCKEMVKSVPGYDKDDKMYLGDEEYNRYIKQCIGTMKAQ